MSSHQSSSRVSSDAGFVTNLFTTRRFFRTVSFLAHPHLTLDDWVVPDPSYQRNGFDLGRYSMIPAFLHRTQMMAMVSQEYNWCFLLFRDKRRICFIFLFLMEYIQYILLGERRSSGRFIRTKGLALPLQMANTFQLCLHSRSHFQNSWTCCIGIFCYNKMFVRGYLANPLPFLLVVIWPVFRNKKPSI